MKDYYIEDDRADMEQYYIDSLDFDSEELDEIENAFEDRAIFKILYFMDSAIVEKIGMPLSGSGFAYNTNESDSGSSYYSLVFKYNPKRKSHYKYLNKVTELFYEEDFFDYCNLVFEERYLAFLEKSNV